MLRSELHLFFHHFASDPHGDPSSVGGEISNTTERTSKLPKNHNTTGCYIDGLHVLCREVENRGRGGSQSRRVGLPPSGTTGGLCQGGEGLPRWEAEAGTSLDGEAVNLKRPLKVRGTAFA